MRMKFRWELMALALGCLAGLNSCAKVKNTGAVSTGLMWIATAGDQSVRAYHIDLTSGGVSQVGNAVATGAQPQAMATTPDGTTLFIGNSTDNTISVYSVSSDGSLKAGSCSSCNTGQIPVALAVDPTGKFLFVANQGVINDNTSGTISVFSISAGSLTPSNPPSFPTETASDTTGTGPSGIAVSPTTFSCTVIVSGAQSSQNCGVIYVANQFTNTVGAYEYFVDGSGNFNLVGAIGGSPYPAGASPTGVAVSRCAGVSTATTNCPTPGANNLFVSNSGSNNVSVFSACLSTSANCSSPDGTLAAVGSPVAACCGPTSLIVDPQQDFVYVLERGAAQIGEFRYSPVTGVLTALKSASVSTGISPFSAGITGNTSNTNWLFVTNSGASSISGFSVSTAGRLAPQSSGPISISGQPTAILVR
jgi:DNA-binding beta-propeller fold protein YncE